MGYKILKDVPVPSRREAKWPFAAMEIGDCTEITQREEWFRAVRYAHVYGHGSGKRFETSWKRGDSCGRIWRVA